MLETGSFVGEEILFAFEKSRYLYTVKVESLSCRFLEFNVSRSLSDYCVKMLAEYVKPMYKAKNVFIQQKMMELEKRRVNEKKKVNASQIADEPEFMKRFFKFKFKNKLNDTLQDRVAINSSQLEGSSFKIASDRINSLLPNFRKSPIIQSVSRDKSVKKRNLIKIDSMINDRTGESSKGVDYFPLKTPAFDADHSMMVLKLIVKRKMKENKTGNKVENQSNEKVNKQNSSYLHDTTSIKRFKTPRKIIISQPKIFNLNKSVITERNSVRTNKSIEILRNTSTHNAISIHDMLQVSPLNRPLLPSSPPILSPKRSPPPSHNLPSSLIPPHTFKFYNPTKPTMMHDIFNPSSIVTPRSHMYNTVHRRIITHHS